MPPIKEPSQDLSQPKCAVNSATLHLHWLAKLQRADLVQHTPEENKCCIVPHFCQGDSKNGPKWMSKAEQANQMIPYLQMQRPKHTVPPSCPLEGWRRADSLSEIYCDLRSELWSRRAGWYYQISPEQDIYKGLTHFQTLFLSLTGK